MTSSPYDPYELGYTRATMGTTKYNNNLKVEIFFKSFLSSNCKLKLVYMKLESLVIVNQNVMVNICLGLVHTARHMREINFT